MEKPTAYSMFFFCFFLAATQFFMSKTLDVIVAYGMSTDEREDAAKTLVRISVYTDHAVDFLSRLLAVEVANCADPNTIFRANSIASKAVDYYMKLIGMPYLTSTYGGNAMKVCPDTKVMSLF